MSDIPDPALADKLAGLAVIVRDNSSQGRLTPLSDCWQAPLDELFEAISVQGTDIDDIESVLEEETPYLFSTKFMTRRYAESAALALTGKSSKIIVETVRYESATYPRPTMVETFRQSPYSLSPLQIETAITEIINSTSYPDIAKVTASDGSVFLFSSEHIHPDQAQSLAEWIAIGDSENP
jgi:hypothetical protein